MAQKMSEAEIRQVLVEIFSEVLGIKTESVTDDLSPDNCENWDSLRHMQICTAIDESFEIALDMSTQVEILTFDLAVETVKAELSNG
ncbi:MAG: acyl carrier protein [Alphaproteobacteria bacterium]|nr:acyl carrier protein [Alphaproteobacteria bacterium]